MRPRRRYPRPRTAPQQARTPQRTPSTGELWARCVLVAPAEAAHSGGREPRGQAQVGVKLHPVQAPGGGRLDCPVGVREKGEGSDRVRLRPCFRGRSRAHFPADAAPGWHVAVDRRSAQVQGLGDPRIPQPISGRSPVSGVVSQPRLADPFLTCVVQNATHAYDNS